MAITAQEKDNLDFSRVDNEGLQNLKSSAEAYEKVIQAAMRIESNTPQQQARYDAHLAEVTEHKAAVEAEMASRLKTEQKLVTQGHEATPKPATQLSNGEIVTEVRELHVRFEQLSEEYKHSAGSERQHVREEMKPVVARENELRQEYLGRAAQELSRDRVPDPVAYSR
jgi:dsDNA-specific endonuclease/ATPase MutS2